MGRPRKNENRSELEILKPGDRIHIGTPLDHATYNKLIERAKGNGRSVAAELRVAVIAYLETKPSPPLSITLKKVEIAEAKAEKNKKT